MSDGDYLDDEWGDTLTECDKHPGCWFTIDFGCPKCVEEEK